MTQEENIKHVISYGAGTNSTAMICEMINREMKIDAIIFSDTGGERPETYDFIQYFNDFLAKKGYPTIVVVRYKTKEGILLTLEQDILNRKTIPPIAFGYKSCSDKYKIRPFDAYVKSVFPKQKIVKYIGFDFSEKRRVKDTENTIYPLVEWQYDRDKCVSIIADAGLRQPHKSSCFFCPNMRVPEILALSEELKKRAINIEENAKETLIELNGLGRQFAWKDLIHKHKTQLNLFEEIDYIDTPCVCIG